MEIKSVKIEKMKPYDKNPRRNQEAVSYVAKSIKEFGFKVPIVIDKNNVIVCGHTRYLACKQLGYTEAPCIVADDLNEEQIRAFRLADNKVAEFSAWDDELLDNELEFLANLDLGFEMEDFGFDLAFDEPEDEEPTPEDVEEVAVPDLATIRPVTKPGDVWKLGGGITSCVETPQTENSLLSWLMVLQLI